MCGRYASVRKAMELGDWLDVDSVEAEAPAAYNVAPTATVPVAVAGEQRVLTVATWGVVAPTGRLVINARVETVAERALFAEAFRRRRCLLPADGWYEWVRDGGAALPYFMSRTDGAPLALAGIWRPDVDGSLRSVVITGAADEPFRWLHDRTPMVVPAAAWDAWLDPSYDDPAALLVPGTAYDVAARRVGVAVNSVANEGPQLVAEVPDERQATLF